MAELTLDYCRAEAFQLSVNMHSAMKELARETGIWLADSSADSSVRVVQKNTWFEPDNLICEMRSEVAISVDSDFAASNQLVSQMLDAFVDVMDDLMDKIAEDMSDRFPRMKDWNCGRDWRNAGTELDDRPTMRGVRTVYTVSVKLAFRADPEWM